MRIWVLLLAACSAPTDLPPGDDPPTGADGAVVPPDDASSAAPCSDKPAQPLDATWTITVGGQSRTARVHVPASYDPTQRTPVVFDVHGRTQNASQQMGLSKSVVKSDAAGFIAIYPESATSPTSWNSGTCCDPASTNDLDDTGFLTKLLDEAEAKLCVDTARVYMMGMSNGGYESHRIACELADRFAAVGPVAGLLLFAGCAPSRPVPVMMVNGTADNLSQYGYVDEGVAFWRDHNQCSTMTTTFSNGDASCVTHGGCTGGADVVLCTIAEGGHQWPGGATLPFMGKKSDNLNATDALWEFFQAHPRP
jgi:polyhydroxybutyrate depolymerase